MAKRKRETTSKKIEMWIKQGKGQGYREDYQPWINIQAVSSLGTCVRRSGIIVERQYNLLSKLEDNYFCFLEGSQMVAGGLKIVDIREQYPLLPQNETITIAQLLGFKHPTDPKTKEPVVMTTDFLITILNSGGKEVYIARTVKPKSELNKKRTMEKFEIERVFWERKGIDWGIVTQDDIPKDFVKNVRELRENLVLQDMNDMYRETIATEILSKIHDSNIPLNKLCLKIDSQLGLGKGTVLRVAMHLIATQRIRVDLFKRIIPTKYLNLITK